MNNPIIAMLVKIFANLSSFSSFETNLFVNVLYFPLSFSWYTLLYAVITKRLQLFKEIKKATI